MRNRGERKEALHVGLTDGEEVTECDGEDNQRVEHPFPNLAVDRAEGLCQDYERCKGCRAFRHYRQIGCDRGWRALIYVGGPQVERNKGYLESDAGDYKRHSDIEQELPVDKHHRCSDVAEIQRACEGIDKRQSEHIDCRREDGCEKIFHGCLVALILLLVKRRQRCQWQ